MSESDALEMKAVEMLETEYAHEGFSFEETCAVEETSIHVAAVRAVVAALSSPPPAVGGEVERAARAICFADGAHECHCFGTCQARAAEISPIFETYARAAIAALTPQGGQ